MKPTWLKLIEQWRAEGNFGLSIPFLVGASSARRGESLSDGLGIDELRALLDSVCDVGSKGIIMRLYRCDKAQDLILAPVDKVPDYCFPVRSQDHQKPSLYVEVGTVPNDDRSFEGLLAALWERYGEEVKAGHFSVCHEVFQPFDAKDREFIDRAIARSDSDNEESSLNNPSPASDRACARS